MKLVVIIPAYNEENTIGQVIKEIPEKIKGINDILVFVIDDGSEDKTKEISLKHGAKVFSNNKNQGVGKAFYIGVRAALKEKADIIVTIDADGQFNPKDIPKLIAPILGNKADFVTTSRFLKKEYEPKMPFIKKFGNRVFTKIISRIVGMNLTDTQCGFRAYSRDCALSLVLFGRYTYTQEVFLDVATKGFRIAEIPLIVKGKREHGKSRVVGSWYGYGLKALTIIIRALRDYKPLKFFGSIGVLFLVTGSLSSLALLVRLLLIHRISPYMSVVYVNLVLMIFGFLMIVLALIADMIGRNRKINEEALILLRKEAYKKS